MTNLKPQYKDSLNQNHIPQHTKDLLSRELEQLNPFQLQKRMNLKIKKILKTVNKKL